jgi:hypothetical protein
LKQGNNFVGFLRTRTHHVYLFKIVATRKMILCFVFICSTIWGLAAYSVHIEIIENVLVKLHKLVIC